LEAPVDQARLTAGQDGPEGFAMAGLRQGPADAAEGTPADRESLATSYRDESLRLVLDGRFAEAEAFAGEALRLRPDDVDAMNSLGVAVWKQGRAREAEEILRRAVEVNPDHFGILTNLGQILMGQRREAEAADCFRAAIRVQPDAFHARMNLGNVISNSGDFEGAAEWLVSALEVCPDSAEALQNIAMNLARQGRWTEAAGYYERALSVQPDNPEIHRNLGYGLLATGQFERGWVEHEWRLNCTPHPGVRINRTFWNGDHFAGRTILLHFEQGFGDTIQFIRYAPLVKARGGRVVVLCQPPLVRLLSRCSGVDMACDGNGFEPDCHIQAPLMSLPAIFGTTMGTIPAVVPYLFPDACQVEHWRSVLTRVRGADPQLVGIAWQGRPENAADHWRSFPLERMAPLASVPGVRLISLQVGQGTEQVAALGGRFPVVELLGRRGRDFSETAAIASLLDLVIAPCTAVAHMAGALGVPVWVALSRPGDWRWFTGREDSPWYPTLRLFRQSRVGNWDGVFGQMADELRKIVARRAEPLTLAAGAA
jgi:Flp pilus assembly protein TadD